MAERLIIWSKTAENQLFSVFEYWNIKTGNKKYSQKINNRVKRAIKVIHDFPFSSKPTDFLDMRQFIFKEYSIFYKITGNLIKIYAFWDNRQDPQKLYELLNQ